MQNAVRSGLIIIINTSKYCCDTIIIEQDDIQALALYDLHIEEINSKAQENDLGKLNILE